MPRKNHTPICDVPDCGRPVHSRGYCARHYRQLRSKGITVRKTIDLVIGTFCIANGHSLLHADRDFEPMEEHLGLSRVPTEWAVHEKDTYQR